MKRVICEADVNSIFKSGKKELELSKNDIITPLAHDRIKSLGISILIKTDNHPKNTSCITPDAQNKESNRIVIGSDHTGFEMKNKLILFLNKKSLPVLDVGTKSADSCDYPDFAFEVAKKVALKDAPRGILLDATGIPSSITANKIPGIRAATCYNEFSAKSSREHNNSNVLVLGAKTLGEETIYSIVDVWLKTEFLGERHQKRLDKITDIEKQFLKEIKSF